MSDPGGAGVKASSHSARIRDWFAASLGVRTERKEEIYADIYQSTTLRDPSYWMQILFSAGIATLGLVLNSPAVIIGAMLISPLMGSILANGLALAAGDLVLGVRAVLNLVLSCAVAVVFAVLLVGLLPFKEITAEIAARTQPNTLDFVVAIFSGAIGSVALCREAKGIVTSIPGVAIAVALMPPLCVVGYGIGVAFSLSGWDGMRIAWGGGLLFLTNLVAITFTAMMVFLGLHIDTEQVKKRMRERRSTDAESQRLEHLLERIPAFERLRKIGGLWGRLLLLLLSILLLLIPLSQSFSQLRTEIVRKQEENRVQHVATDVWQQSFAFEAGGEARSYISQLSSTARDGKLVLDLRVFTGKPYSAAEKNEFRQQVAAKLGKPAESVALQLVEIPTTSSELLARAREAEAAAKQPPTIAQLQARFIQAADSALLGLRLPDPAQFVSYELTTTVAPTLSVQLYYLSPRDIDADAQALISRDIQSRLAYPNAGIALKRIPVDFGEVTFGFNQAVLASPSNELLDQAGQLLQERPNLQIVLQAGAARREREGIAQERANGLREYLAANWKIAPQRMSVSTTEDNERKGRLIVGLSKTNP